MRNYLTSGGLLEEGRSFRDSQFVGQQKADSDFENMPPFRPKDAAEDEYFRRTMVSAGQDADGIAGASRPAWCYLGLRYA